MITDLESAIKHYEIEAEVQEKLYRLCPASELKLFYCDGTKDCKAVKKGKNKGCLKCASEHQQLAEWLRELKCYKDRQDLINKNWQELIRYKEGVEKIKMRSQSYRECGENILASGMEQALDILTEVNADEDNSGT